MDGGGSLRKVVFTVLFVFCGVGGGALGFKRAKAEFRRLGVAAEFKILGGIELDPSTARDFERLTGAPCLVADPRPVKPCHPCTYGVVPWDGSSHTITGNTVPGGGPFSVADPRLTCTPRENAGAYGVLPWSQHAWTVTAHACHDNGWFSAADPRALADLAKRVPFPLILAEDGTWHRPLTTLECAVLQGFDAVDEEGAPFVLDGGSDKVRVKIGDAVPPPAAEAIARQMLFTLVDAAMGSFSLSSGGAVWVRDKDVSQQGGLLQ